MSAVEQVNEQKLAGTSISRAHNPEFLDILKTYAAQINQNRTSLVNEVTPTTDIRSDRVVAIDSGGSVEEGNGHDNSVLGVNNTLDADGNHTTARAGEENDIVIEGAATVTASEQNIAILARLAQVPGGLVSTFVDSDTYLATVAASGANDDFTAGQFAVAGFVQIVSDFAGDTTQTITVVGENAGVFVTEDIALNGVTAVTGTSTFTEVHAFYSDAALNGGAGTLTVRTTVPAVIKAVVVAAAGWFGRVLTNTADDCLGHGFEIWGSGAVAGTVWVIGTKGSGVQREKLTMNGTTHVQSTLSWDTVTTIYCGADDAVTISYSLYVKEDRPADFVGFAWTAITKNTTGEAVIGTGARWTIWLMDLLASTANGEGASLISLEDAAALITATDLEAAILELIGGSRALTDTIRSARTGGVFSLTATTDIAVNLMAHVDAAGNFEVADGTGVTLGVNNTAGTIAAGVDADVIREGPGTVTAGLQGVTAGDDLASVPGGAVSLINLADHSLMGAVASGADDDFAVGTLNPAGEAVQVYSSGAGDVAQNVTIHGVDSAGAYLTEVIGPLAGVAPVVGGELFAEVYAVYVDALMAGTLEVETAAAVTIKGTLAVGAAIWFGQVLTDVSDDALGHGVDVWCAAACTGTAMIVGTDGAGADQYEIITMTGTVHVKSLLSWNAITAVYCGPDGAATASYSVLVPADLHQARAGGALATIAQGATGLALMGS